MIICALVAVSFEIAIPLLTKSVVDRAIKHASRGLLVELGIAAIAFGAIQSTLNFFRRWVQASAVAGMERSIRADLYAHLQRLEPGFHDSWQSGQLLSRATTDLSSIRRFGGFGVVFFITNIWTFLVVVVLLIRLNWWLGLLTAGVFVPVFILCMAFEKRYRLLSRRVQDEQGDLATYIEEAAAGIRVLKALGRRDEAQARHTGQARRVYGTQVAMARLRGSFWGPTW
jgi:ATP-binding cassette subfamily B protein